MARDEEQRPDADSLLELSQEEEAGRGRLTIYFGAAPGVGKTYAMLTDARQRKREGVDVVVGYYEAHARPETEALIEGQEIIPPLVIDYKGVALKEADVDAIIRRRPQLVLVDELAHTNAPGSRHLKRFQDVEELLEAGIDVYATLNVQHLESMNDVIFQITGMRVRERVPDTVFQAADEVKVIDLPIEELLKRLEEGKVYVKHMAEEAIRRFFLPGNLIALREMALKLSAERIDGRLRVHMKARAVAGPWPITERILVSVYASPYAERLVRSTFRIASKMDAEWFAIYVEGPGHARLSEQERLWLGDALDLARKLGAQVVWLKGDDVAEEISRYAKNANITKIVMGKPGRLWYFPTIVRKIIARTRDIDIFLFASETWQPPLPPKPPMPLRPLRYLYGLLAVGLTSAVGHFLQGLIGETNLLFLMLVPVIWSALSLGRGPSIFAALASIVAFDFLFVPPHFTFAIADFKMMISFIVYIAVAVVISNLASKLRYRLELLRQSEARSMALCEVGKHLVTTKNVEQILSTLVHHVRQILPCEIAIFVPRGEELSLGAATAGFPVDAKEQSVAAWVFINGRAAGQGTDTLPQAYGHYLAMRTAEGIKGIMGVRFKDPKHYATPENDAALDAIASLGAMAIERVLAEERDVDVAL